MVIGACHELLLPRVYGAPHRQLPDDFAATVTGTLLHGIATTEG
jgi:hypothetical protein